jgi:hypothetical protein
MKLVHFIVIAVMFIIGVLTFMDMTEPYEHNLSFEVLGQRAVVRGTTDSQSHNLIKDFVRENPNVKTLILQDMPGTMDMSTNRRVVLDLRAAGLRTHVPADGRIASGAVDWFIAGSPRTISCGAMIGVHSWSTAVGERADKTFYDGQRATQRYFLSKMSVDPDFYDFTRAAAGPDDIHWLTVDEMLRYRLITKDPQCGA